MARRMLAQPPARQAADEFFAQWLRFDRVLGSVKDRRRYPEFTPELAAMMVQETRMLLGNLVWNDGNFMEAFTADYSFLNSDLARLYGVPSPSGEFELVKFPAGATRAGIIGQASFLTSTAGPVETSPTARGHLHPRAAALPARPESAARREHRSTGANAGEAVADAAADAGAHGEPDVRGLPSPDGPDRVRPRELRRRGPMARRRAHRVRDGTHREQEGRAAHRQQGRDRRHRQLELLRARADRAGARRQAARARSASSSRYSGSRSAAWKHGADRDAVREAFTAFRESGFKFKELLVALVRSPQFLDGLDEKSQVTPAQVAR